MADSLRDKLAKNTAAAPQARAAQTGDQFRRSHASRRRTLIRKIQPNATYTEYRTVPARTEVCCIICVCVRRSRDRIQDRILEQEVRDNE